MNAESQQRRMLMVLPAIAMSVGWGFRGFIGGGPLGAMIPGALVAMALSLLLDRKQRDCAVAAAFGAVGIGLGGQMTYGQTVGFLADAETLVWGVTGLTVKGAVWGLSGGAILGTAFAGARRHRVVVLAALVIMLAGTYVGWKLVNAPKLLYFSHPVDRPREEVWAGLLLGGLLYLAYLGRAGLGKIPAWFALYGTIGGGIGFGFGGALKALGQSLPVDHNWYPWWKLMEFTFGLLFGLALGMGAYRLRKSLVFSDGPREPARDGRAQWLVAAATVLLAVVILWVEPSIPGRFAYSIVGAGLLVIALYSDSLAWHIAVTLTVTAFAADLGEYFHEVRRLAGPVLASSVTAIAFACVFAAVTWRRASGRQWLPWAFLLLLGTALGDSLVKAVLHPQPYKGGWIVQVVFVALSAYLLRLVRERQELPGRGAGAVETKNPGSAHEGAGPGSL